MIIMKVESKLDVDLKGEDRDTTQDIIQASIFFWKDRKYTKYQ
jgi:hypothetical protein